MRCRIDNLGLNKVSQQHETREGENTFKLSLRDHGCVTVPETLWATTFRVCEKNEKIKTFKKSENYLV